MENAIVTFKSKDTNREINIDLSYNKDTSELEYDVKMSSEYSANSAMDFIGFLADMFLKSLQLEDKN